LKKRQGGWKKEKGASANDSTEGEAEGATPTWERGTEKPYGAHKSEDLSPAPKHGAESGHLLNQREKKEKNTKKFITFEKQESRAGRSFGRGGGEKTFFKKKKFHWPKRVTSTLQKRGEVKNTPDY